MWGEGGVNTRECTEPPAAVVTTVSVAVCSSANRSLQPRNSNTEVKLYGNILQHWSWVIRAPHRALILLLTGLASSLSLFWSRRVILSDSLCMLQCLCPQGHSSWSLALSGGEMAKLYDVPLWAEAYLLISGSATQINVQILYNCPDKYGIRNRTQAVEMWWICHKISITFYLCYQKMVQKQIRFQYSCCPQLVKYPQDQVTVCQALWFPSVAARSTICWSMWK